MNLKALGGVAPIRATEIWISAGKGVGEYAATLERPDVEAKPISDLKEWAITGEKDPRTIILPNLVVEVRALDALTHYLRGIAGALELRPDQPKPIWFLLPAEREEVRHRRYRRALKVAAEDAFPKGSTINFLFEPDMVLEYFRLVRGELRLEKDRQQIILVVDCGALTCNMTLAFSTKEGVATVGSQGKRRVLQSIGASTRHGAGRSVDSILLHEARTGKHNAFEQLGLQERLSLVERLKIAVSRSGRSQQIVAPDGSAFYILSPERLRKESVRIWQTYQSVLSEVLIAGFEQLNKSARHRSVLDESGIMSPAQLTKLIDVVVLSGGTSQLVGFEDSMLEILSSGLEQESDRPRILRARGDYAAIPALGGMAHILERQEIFEVQASAAPDEETPQDEDVEFVPSLLDDIHFAFRTQTSDHPGEIFIQRDDWPLGLSEDESVWPLQKPGTNKVSVSLTYGPLSDQDNFVPHIHHSHWISLQDGTKRLELKVARTDLDSFRVSFPGKKETRTVHYQVSIPKAPGKKPRIPKPVAQTGGTHIYCLSTDDLVIDLGMSKTVVASAEVDREFASIEFESLVHTLDGDPLPPGWQIVEAQSAVLPTPPSVATPPHSEPRPLRSEHSKAVISERANDEPSKPAKSKRKKIEGANASPPANSPKASEVASELAEGAVVATERTLQKVTAPALPIPTVTAPILPLAASDSPISTVALSTRLAKGSRHRAAPLEAAELPTPDAVITESVTLTDLDSEKLLAAVDVPMSPTPSKRATFAESPSVYQYSSEKAFLLEGHGRLQAAGYQISLADLTVLHLAAKTRPLILLAGPPGVGKSSLAHQYARLLGCSANAGSYCRIAVQANWTSDEPLIERHQRDPGLSSPSPLLSKFLSHGHRYEELLQVVLLDEFNLSRPEYYLSNVLSMMEAAGHEDGGKSASTSISHLPRTRDHHHRLLWIGTLNIDEVSRIPSDKIVDRAFVLEYLPNPRWRMFRKAPKSIELRRISEETWSSWCELPEEVPLPPELEPLLEAMSSSAGTWQSRPYLDPTPSYRALRDVAAFIHYFDRLEISAEEFKEADGKDFIRMDAVDRAVCARVFPRIRGERSSIEGVLKRLSELLKPGDSSRWERCYARVTSMSQQLESGYASFWG